MARFVVSVVGREPGVGLSGPRLEGRVAFADRGSSRDGFISQLHDGRLLGVVTVRARDAGRAQVRAERVLSRAWPVPLGAATTTVKELYRRRHGWAVEWSTQDPGDRGGDGGGAGALVPRRPRGPVGPVSVARRTDDDRP